MISIYSKLLHLIERIFSLSLPINVSTKFLHFFLRIDLIHPWKCRRWFQWWYWINKRDVSISIHSVDIVRMSILIMTKDRLEEDQTRDIIKEIQVSTYISGLFLFSGQMFARKSKFVVWQKLFHVSKVTII